MNTSVHEGHAVYDRDPKTGEIVQWWYYYVPDCEQYADFSQRFDPKDYVTEEQLGREYRLTQGQRNQLGGYNKCADRLSYPNRWGATTWRTMYWWKRERVEAIVRARAGQLNLF